jgi:SAM-dependent methyltransferase
MTLYKNCPICEGSAVRTLLLRKSVPVHQNLLMKDRASAINIRRGDLDLTVCENCEFVFNRAFDESQLEYGESYENAQYYSPSFNAHLDALVEHLIAERNVRGCRVVEVGCGQGTFLRKLVEADAGNVGHGFDPSYHGPLSDLAGRLNFHRTFYDENSSHVTADVVVSRHVIEHVADPVSLLRNIRKALVNSPSARIFCETPCVEWIVRNKVVWDFFYEHCSYFNDNSLATAFRLAGFEVVEVRHVFEGQYLWLEANVSGQVSAPKDSPGSEAFLRLAQEFAVTEKAMLRHWRDGIRKLAANEKIALWGAGAKGVTLANLLEPDSQFIDCVVDINPQKQGYYLPGTGHPIVAPAALTGRGVSTAILMNPNYLDENLSILKAGNIDVHLTEQV